MAFTSSATNKNNIFHIGPKGPGANLLVVVKETLLFNLLQQAMLRVPVVPVEEFSPLTTPKTTGDAGESFSSICINVRRVINSAWRVDENLLWKRINGNPAKIISCSIQNVSLVDKFIPLNHNEQAIAIAIYHYTVEIKYIDSSGQLYITSIDSGTRYQRVVFPSFTGQLQINLENNCIFSKFYPLSMASYPLSMTNKLDLATDFSPPQPTRVWLKSSVVK
ncbi:MAG: hypothetical protein GX248_09430 [Peptococcaceae bacterium]|jgi:hypothetical protein|nr:hypothetical protein [Peptococcaceae bacterium]